MPNAIKTLCCFGDSWPAGAELAGSDFSKRFPNLIAQNLAVQCKNFAEGGTSIDQAAHRFLSMLTEIRWSKGGVLFCLTAFERGIFFVNGEPTELHPAVKQTANTSYYAHIYSDELHEFNRIRNVLLVQSLCKNYNIPLWFVCNWNRNPNHVLIDNSKFYSRSLIEVLGLDGWHGWRPGVFDQMINHEYITPNANHPNLQGHAKIADALTEWIKETL